MFRSYINYRIGLICKQIEYNYVTFKNNKAIEKAFVRGFQVSPFARSMIFTKDHPVALSLFVTSFVISLVVLSKPISFSKPLPQNLDIDKKIKEKLTNMQPSSPKEDFLEKKEETKPQQIKIKPFETSPVISRKAFLEKASQYTLLVNKRTKKLLVTKEKEAGYSVVEEFPISLGEVPGNKEVKGDRKTPEGVYTLIDLKTDEELPKKYGPYAAVLNYPNEKDLKQGKTGAGIWIHGTGTDQLTPDTQGCVELADKHLIHLFSFISKGTKVIILPEAINVSPQKNIVQKEMVRVATAS